MNTIFESPFCVIFSHLLSLIFSYSQIFSSVSCSEHLEIEFCFEARDQISHLYRRNKIVTLYIIIRVSLDNKR